MAVRVHLIVTGDAEELALSDALAQLFPSDVVDFTTQKVDGFTSNPLEPPTDGLTNEKACEIVRAMLAAVNVGEKRMPADYAVALDDLELANATQVDVVLDHVRAAVDSCVETGDGPETIQRGRRKNYRELTTAPLRREALRRRCSFHLAVPMVESWFFGEPDALCRAGVPDPAVVRFDKSTRDIEDFETTDPNYLKPERDRYYWAKGESAWRARHPKYYISYLRDPCGALKRPERYKETIHGRNALATLAWVDVVRPETHAQFVAALLEDIAAMVGQPLPFSVGKVHPSVRTGSDGYLRNIGIAR